MEAIQSPIQQAVGSVFVHVTDVRRSAEWYGMVMGLPLLEERLNGGPVYWLALEGGTGLILDDNRNNASDAKQALYSYKTDDIEEAYRFLSQLGAELPSPIERPHPGLAYFRFADPDGNALMVTESDYDSPVVQPLAHAPSPIMNKIASVFLNVTDMNRAIKFHSEVLGLLYREVEANESVYVLPMKSGSGVLLDDNRYRQGDSYKTLFMFAARDVEGARAYLQRNGVEIFTDIERHGDMAFFTVKDPDGNVVMVCSE
ncbi:VOC family protein [Paenibacillus arenilitoris]|uniref:VOC family protein n=1 Tax=Paenibacillus arenilitoris TaxID=2772299 RepID=A0A927CKW6_9BACL|nr:VOC family protein [Paenibacillus arenilitoris]MBD2869424.1 VOC family protein [Paenibacillus arenilitoris]